MTPAATTDIRRLVYTVRAKHQGERLAFDIARGEFVCLIGSDPRTARRFEAWAKATGIDSAVADYAGYLEGIARGNGLSDRSALFDENGTLRDGLVAPKDFRTTVAGLDKHLAQLANSAETRQIVAVDLAYSLRDILSGMYPQQFAPMMPWLGLDLMTVFGDNIQANARGWQIARFELVPSPALDEDVPSGQRPKHDGEGVRRNIRWVYRHWVAGERASVADLSTEYCEARRREGVSLEPDTKVVRDGLAEGRRLLELPVPLSQWSDTFMKVR